ALQQLLFLFCCALTRPLVLRPFVSTTREQLLLLQRRNKVFVQAERELGLRQGPPAPRRVAVSISPSEGPTKDERSSGECLIAQRDGIIRKAVAFLDALALPSHGPQLRTWPFRFRPYR